MPELIDHLGRGEGGGGITCCNLHVQLFKIFIHSCCGSYALATVSEGESCSSTSSEATRRRLVVNLNQRRTPSSRLPHIPHPLLRCKGVWLLS